MSPLTMGLKYVLFSPRDQTVYQLLTLTKTYNNADI